MIRIISQLNLHFMIDAARDAVRILAAEDLARFAEKIKREVEKSESFFRIGLKVFKKLVNFLQK